MLVSDSDVSVVSEPRGLEPLETKFRKFDSVPMKFVISGCSGELIGSIMLIVLVIGSFRPGVLSNAIEVIRLGCMEVMQCVAGLLRSRLTRPKCRKLLIVCR